MIRENVTVDSRFSGNWLDMTLSEWALRTHEKSSDDEEEKKKNDVEERKEGGEEGKLESIVIPSQFHRKHAGFRIIPEDLLHIMEWKELQTMTFMCFFMCLFIFIKSLFLPGKFKYSPQ